MPRGKGIAAVTCAVGIALAATPARTATLFVDGSLPADCPAAYDPTARSCGSGAETAYADLAAAAAAAVAGDVVEIRAGTYEEPLVPANGGSEASPLVFRAYAAEEPVVANVDDPALRVIGLSWITIEGLTVQDSLGWARLESATHVVLRDNVFLRATATGTTGGVKLVDSSYCRLEGNRFEDGNDNVVVQHSDYNVVAGNTFVRGRHSLFSLRCGSFNVVRGNRFENPDQKAAEIYDCEGVSDAPYLLDATKRNLVEGNVFALTLGSDADHRYNGIQYAGQDGIVRFNVFHDCAGGGLNFQVYPDEALYNYGHRAYRNTFFANACHGLAASNDVSDDYHDNFALGNLLHANTGCAGEAEQLRIGNDVAVVLRDNAIVDVAPGFVDGTSRDLRLADGSPMIDAGPWLTRTVGAGSGTSLPVEDAAYFFDGSGIDGETGDLVQLEGSTERAVAIDVDVPGGRLTPTAP